MVHCDVPSGASGRAVPGPAREGILSLNDVVLNAKMADEAASNSIDYGHVVKTYQAICERELAAAAVSAG